VSVQFGKCSFDGKPVDIQQFDEFRNVLAPFGPDGQSHLCKDNFAVLYLALHTRKESRCETQPYVSRSGLVFTWDGRLDNRKDLIEKSGGQLCSDSTDLEIIAAGHERWGRDLFSKLIGDWALSVWNPIDQSLVLAKDFVGTRSLYYCVEQKQVTWCTILDPLVLFARHRFELENEYLAGWLSFFPATHLTPYVGIYAVPPSCFIRFARGQASADVTKYWDFNPSKQIRYRTDKEYEDHFRCVFKESVRRRLRCDSLIVAELSGGMDSSSIVCMADEIARHEPSTCNDIETASYYDNSEPNCDDQIYFTLIEQKRGRAGFHLSLSGDNSVLAFDHGGQFIPIPGAKNDSGAVIDFAALMRSKGARTLLSGLGGDEVTGGVPTPVPELVDLLARVRLRILVCQLKRWALQNRKPWIHLLWETIQEFLPECFLRSSESILPPVWLRYDFADRYGPTMLPDRKRARIFGPLPSFQMHLKVLEILRRQLACSPPERAFPCEKRYPYLDRDLLEFLFAIPREQLVRPGQRRSLMRRALVGIVPAEILDRRRKAFVVRGPISHIANHWSEILEFSRKSMMAALGMIDEEKFLRTLDAVRVGSEVAMIPLLRAFAMEQWLRNSKVRKCLVIGEPDETGSVSPSRQPELCA
jgi:asparagine synthase (glutamine-hydrolysing)